MESIWLDMRLALRRLRTQRAFALGVTMLLGCGVAASTIVFSIVHAVLLAPLPYPEGDRIHLVLEREVASGEDDSMAYRSYRDLGEATTSFDRLGASRFDNFNLTGATAPQQVRAACVDAGFFAVLGATPIVGRVISPEESHDADRSIAVLGHALWRNQFGGDPDIVGRVIELDGVPREVIGVLPSDFDEPTWADLWLPLGDLAGNDRSRREVMVYARLAPGVEVASAQADLAVLSERWARDHAATHEDRALVVESLRDATVGSSRSMLLALFAGVGALMLIVCLNIAGLQLARGLERRRELAVRAALGAGRARVVVQLLVENVVLALCGGAVGVVLAVWGLDLLVRLAPDAVPRLSLAQINVATLSFALGTSLLAVLLFGVLPSLRAARVAISGVLKSGAEGHDRMSRLRPLLVVAQVALSVVLLIGAGLIGRSFQALLSVDLAFDADRLVTMGVVLPSDRFPEGHQKIAWMDHVRDQLERTPGVERASVVNWPLLSAAGSRVDVQAAGASSARTEPVQASVRIVGAGFLETAGIGLRAGRAFDNRDGASGADVAMVSETLARRVWGDRNPLGQHVTYAERGASVTAEVVGVVADARLAGPTEPAGAVVFRPYDQEPWGYANLLVRMTDPGGTGRVAALQEAVWSVDRDRPLFAVGSLDALLEGFRGRPRFSALLSGLFSLFALALSAIGLYGMMSFAVHRRRREIGIRLALGAMISDVRRMVVRRGMLLAATGVAIGLVGGWVATRWIESMLFGVSPLDPVTLATVVGILFLATFVASYGPATRASQVDPARTLRRD